MPSLERHFVVSTARSVALSREAQQQLGVIVATQGRGIIELSCVPYVHRGRVIKLQILDTFNRGCQKSRFVVPCPERLNMAAVPDQIKPTVFHLSEHKRVRPSTAPLQLKRSGLPHVVVLVFRGMLGPLMPCSYKRIAPSRRVDRIDDFDA